MIVMITMKRCILELTNEGMKEASMSSKEKGIKTSYLKKLSKIGVKFPIDEPHFPIQGHAICPIKDNEKVSSSVMVSYVSPPNEFTQQQNTLEYYIRMNLMENSHKIKSLRESVKFSMDAIERIIKHCTMMNNQVEQMILMGFVP
jgi:hypothetical protein